MRPNFINGSKCKEALIELIGLGDDGPGRGCHLIFGPSAATLIGAPAKWTILKQQQQPGIMTSAIRAPRGLVCALNVGHEAGAKADNFMGYTFPPLAARRGALTRSVTYF